MFKNKVPVLTLALLLSSGISQAAENPFADVPAGHWSKTAISQLAADGIIEGYGNGKFQGDAPLTRYEMAQMIARALAKDTPIAEKDQQLLQKLTQEYAAELTNLGIRIDTLEKKTDNLKISGYGYLRFQRQIAEDQATGKKTTTNLSRAYLEPLLTARVNDQWNAVGQFQITKDLDSDADTDSDMVAKGMSVNGKLGNASVRLGKFEQYTQEAIIFHEYTSGGEISFGNLLKTRLTLGQVSNAMNLLGETKNRVSYRAAEFTYDYDKTLQLNAGYFSLSGDELEYTRGEKSPAIYSVGFNKKLDKNWLLTGFYSKASSDISKGKHVENTSSMINFNYKGAKLSCPDSFGIYLKYIQLPKLNQIYTDVGHQYNYKGFEVGGMYMLSANMRGHIRYYHGEDVDNSQKQKDLFRTELRFFF